jgi:hypothetical protein
MAAKYLEYLRTNAKGSDVYDLVLIEANVLQYELRALSQGGTVRNKKSRLVRLIDLLVLLASSTRLLRFSKLLNCSIRESFVVLLLA